MDSLKNHFIMEQMMGIEPTGPAWDAGMLPITSHLHMVRMTGLEPAAP